MSDYIDKNIVEAIARIDSMTIDELKSEFEKYGLSPVPLKGYTFILKDELRFEKDMVEYKNLRLPPNITRI